MPLVPSAEAEWLGSPATKSIAVSVTATAWGTDSAVRDTISAFSDKASADAEAARQIAFIEMPKVIETLSVVGQRYDLIGRPVTLTSQGMGYEAGLTVFVIAAEENEGRTILTVIRRMT